jgi:hypothetical protein
MKNIILCVILVLCSVSCVSAADVAWMPVNQIVGYQPVQVQTLQTVRIPVQYQVMVPVIQQTAVPVLIQPRPCCLFPQQQMWIPSPVQYPYCNGLWNNRY